MWHFLLDIFVFLFVLPKKDRMAAYPRGNVNRHIKIVPRAKENDWVPLPSRKVNHGRVSGGFATLRELVGRGHGKALCPDKSGDVSSVPP